MDIDKKEKFNTLWRKYFDDAELPITFYYTNEEDRVEIPKINSIPRCVIAALQPVRKGTSVRFDTNSIGCSGGKRYLGFSEELMPNFEYFLSCGIPGKLEGERYKKSPELVKEIIKRNPPMKAPAQFIVFKRWDVLDFYDDPEVVIFFAKPDVLSGLFTLANFDEVEPDGVFTPFGSGCSSIVQHPYLEKESAHPRGVLGLFDISARPFIAKDTLTFSVPINKFIKMIDNMDESFLITKSWGKIQKRISAE